MKRAVVGAALVALVALAGHAGLAAAQSPPSKDYLLFVGSEGNDAISLVRFGPAGARVERSFRMGTNPTELLGPHGMAAAPDGRYYYVTTAHGTPGGALWKFTTIGDSLAGRAVLGNFPATAQVSANGAFVWVVNFNLYGDMVPSTVSVVYAPDMIEVARIRTCVMPHGSRLDPTGRFHYSACMMNDMLVEIDAQKYGVSRHFMLGRGREHGMAGAPGAHGAGSHDMTEVSCSPTWAQPSTDGKRVYVACNKSNEVVEIDATSWSLVRRIPAGDGVYNLALTADGGLLVATNKRGRSVSVLDTRSGETLATIPTKRRVPSGVVVSPDGRYAFVTLEGIGSEPGTVEVFDLMALRSVASVDVGPQAGGIDLWKVETPP